MTSEISPNDMRFWQKRFLKLREEIATRVVGQDELLNILLMALLCEGHVLLIGAPGMGKSLVLRALAETLSLNLRSVMHQANFVGTNLLLVEELDRTEPVFRRELLTAMQEKECIFQEEVLYLARPFLVFATLNPGGDGRRDALTQAEKDRFLFSYQIPYPSKDEERIILQRLRNPKQEQKNLQKILSANDLITLQRQVKALPLEPLVENRILRILESSRKSFSDTQPNLDTDPALLDNPLQLSLMSLKQKNSTEKRPPVEENFSHVPPNLSTRTGIGLMQAAQAHAFVKGYKKARIEDLLAVEPLVLSHRQFRR
ncbi:MAG: MoxR family ATPase [Candidatus Cloacimonetes bacterium]|nr:MoxR family ATPase [Candidatus Cloacimonadota bacterium]